MGAATGAAVEKIVPFSQKHGILEVRFSRAERWAVRMDDEISCSMEARKK